MANITNRSPWVVKLVGAPARKFRLKSQAFAYLGSQGHTARENLSKGVLRQLTTAFEVQIKRKDREGNTVTRNSTFDTLAEAEHWAKETERALDSILRQHGGFALEYETMTVKEALNRLHKEHYASKASAGEIAHRIKFLAEWLGPHKLFRDVTRSELNSLLSELQKTYAASSVRNFMTVLTTLYKHAAKRWDFPIENRATGLALPRVQNAIQRYWEGDEKERLLASIDKTSPWLRPIVELSLAMAFRRGELVQGAKRSKGSDAGDSPADRDSPQAGGLHWEHIDFESKQLRLPREKNDHTKKNTEYLGRTVPLTPELRKILLPLHKESKTKKGLVFSATTNSVTQAFSNCCAKAVPPIKMLTFHSLRKIATKDLSRRVKTPMELSRLSGHKNIEVLNKRYYEVRVEELYAQLAATSGTLRYRALTVLDRALGPQQTKQFLQDVRRSSSVEDFLEEARSEETGLDD